MLLVQDSSLLDLMQQDSISTSIVLCLNSWGLCLERVWHFDASGLPSSRVSHGWVPFLE